MTLLNLEFNFEYRIPSSSKPHQIAICCPFCEKRGKTKDTKFHLGIDLRRKIYHCYRCDAKTSDGDNSINNLIEFSNLTSPVANDLDQLRKRLNSIGKPKEGAGILDLDQFSWPIDPIKTPFAYTYMKDVRNFSDLQIEELRLRVGKEYEDPVSKKKILRWCGRVIFPFYEDGVPVFAVGRTYVERDPKYLNSLGNKNLVVYGLDRVKSGTAILCEGIISAIAAEKAVGIPAVAILGKSPTYWQLVKLRSKCHTIYKSLDGGLTPEENQDVRRKLSQHGFTVYEVLLPGESDPDDLGDEYKFYFEKSKKVSLF